MHYQPQYHLLKDRIILVTGASDGITVKPPSPMRATAQAWSWLAAMKKTARRRARN